jgi:hypothetical protein
MGEDDWIEVTPDGTYTITKPGVYGFTLDGVRHPVARVTSTDPVTVTQDRELPKDAPAAQYEGRPEKWRTMNRAQRRAAKRGR